MQGTHSSKCCYYRVEGLISLAIHYSIDYRVEGFYSIIYGLAWPASNIAAGCFFTLACTRYKLHIVFKAIYRYSGELRIFTGLDSRLSVSLPLSDALDIQMGEEADAITRTEALPNSEQDRS